jgi:hypothetical protein
MALSGGFAMTDYESRGVSIARTFFAVMGFLLAVAYAMLR